jgi:hypothetical protein
MHVLTMDLAVSNKRKHIRDPTDVFLCHSFYQMQIARNAGAAKGFDKARGAGKLGLVSGGVVCVSNSHKSKKADTTA